MTKVIVTFTAEGWHAWHAAPAHRDYLARKHRHLFHVRVEMEVNHEDREIECHDLRDFCIAAFDRGQFFDRSCETMARELAEKLIINYGKRELSVMVLEDNENGASYII